MSVTLKKLRHQVVVITGASSGIGLVTARMAARRGARLVLAARSSDALHQLTDEITRDGGQAIGVIADVGKHEEVREIARAAKDTFGGFDTWINNAGISIYGKLEEVSIDDMRRLFDTNFWGLVYGSLEAARHFKTRHEGGGAIINVGSTLSDRAVLVQGIYSASKHAVKGFTDALRMELEEEGEPVSVTLIKPGAIDTPYPHHAKNYLDAEPTNPGPVYAPDTVARTILYCAETPERDVFVGAGGKGTSLFGQYLPRLADKVMESLFLEQQKSHHPPRPREQNGLDRPSGRLEERGRHEGHVAETSLYTHASLHPLLTGAALVGAGFAVTALWRAARNGFAANGTRNTDIRRRQREAFPCTV
ncbi:MAG TPA: SDR family oxidoreductase [Nitrospiraceae bacterium]|nr:SDR family oxidoreductase [Nitrospiraceae bacterium]